MWPLTTVSLGRAGMEGAGRLRPQTQGTEQIRLEAAHRVHQSRHGCHTTAGNQERPTVLISSSVCSHLALTPLPLTLPAPAITSDTHPHVPSRPSPGH